MALPVFILAMVADLAPAWLPDALSMRTVQWIEFVLATPVVLWGGWPFFVRGWQSLVNRNLNMFTLIALGIGVAWSYSVVAMLLPAAFPARHAARRVARCRSISRPRRSSSPWCCWDRCWNCVPAAAPAPPSRRCSAWRRKPPASCATMATEEDIPLEQVQTGDILRVRPGEKVPVDGMVTKATATSMNPWSPANQCRWKSGPVTALIGATVNGTGSLLMRARKGRARHPAGADRADGQRGAAHRVRRFRSWPTWSPASSCRRWCLLPSLPLLVWGCWGPGAAPGPCA